MVDELGEPIAGLPLVLEVSGKHPLVTDGDGRVRLDGIYPSTGHAHIEDLATLRETVRPRWDQIRPGDWLEPEPDHSFIPLRGSEAIVRSVLSETLHTLVIQPWVIRARLIGMYFDTSKCFLLPSALGDIKKLKKLYDEYPDSEIMVVGHTDKTGDASYNDPLSLERADSVATYMRDDVDAWLSWYGYGKDNDKRWGAKEDQHMLQSLLDYDTRKPGESAVWWFQRTRGLGLDGWAGDETRRQLITEYMAHDGTTLPASAHLTTHGCGESFPFTDDELAELDLLDADPDQRDRRVELYLFDRPLSVQPPPPGNISAPGSLEYPGVTETVRQSLRRVSEKPLAYAPAPDEAPHPRLVAASHAAPTQGRSSTQPNATIITIDLCFLPVTVFLVKLRKDMLGALYDQSPNTLRRRSEANKTFINTKMRPVTGRVRFFECTLATPRLWATAHHLETPKKLPLHLAYFLMPKTPEYQKGDQIELSLLGDKSLDNLQRYLLSPPLNRPFFIRNKLNVGSLKNDIRHHDWLTDNPECGFLEQIVKTPSCALVLPLPNGNTVKSHYGDLAAGPLTRTAPGGTTVDVSVAGLSRSLRRAMVADAGLRRNLIGSTMREMRIAVGGFSVGAIDAVSVLDRNRTTVTELYWVDPSTDVIANQRSQVQSWLTMDSDRVVRLVGGSQYAALHDLHAQLLASAGGDSKRVTIIPEPSFFEPANPDRTYVAAVAAPVHAGMASAEEFSAPNESAGALTELTETVLVSRSPLKLSRRGETERLSCHAFEAAGTLRFKWFPPRIAAETAKEAAKGNPPPPRPDDPADEVRWKKYEQDLAEYEKTIVGFVNDGWTLAEFARSMNGPPGMPGEGHLATMRHQWAACGGRKDPGRGDAFEGHLEQCVALGRLGK